MSWNSTQKTKQLQVNSSGQRAGKRLLSSACVSYGRRGGLGNRREEQMEAAPI